MYFSCSQALVLTKLNQCKQFNLMGPSLIEHFSLSILFGLIIFPNVALCGSCNTLYKKCEMRMDEHNKPEKLLCNGGLSKKYLQNFHFSQKPRIIVICQVMSNSIDPTFLSVFPHLYRLSIINSPTITKFSHAFPIHRHLQVLNLTRLGLTQLSLNTLEGLKELKVLDLSYNNLKHLDRHLLEYLPDLQQLYLRSNNWECNSHLKWILNPLMGKKLMDVDEMVCGPTKFHDKPVLAVMQLLKHVRSDCPKVEGKLCDCTLDNLVWSPNREYLAPVITVNCSRLNLTSLPSSLPANTTTLLLMGNKISDISSLKYSSLFSDVSDIYLDDNIISDIDMLEGAIWLTKFRVLSLRKNKISSFQTFVLENGFRKNSQMAKVCFGNNPWICDCTFTPSFKELLVKYYELVADINSIQCSDDEGDDNYLKPIVDLKLSSICTDQNSILSPIGCLNLLLALLIMLTFSKLIYDYWVFKSSGKLPWIITKIP